MVRLRIRVVVAARGPHEAHVSTKEGGRRGRALCHKHAHDEDWEFGSLGTEGNRDARAPTCEQYRGLAFAFCAFVHLRLLEFKMALSALLNHGTPFKGSEARQRFADLIMSSPTANPCGVPRQASSFEAHEDPHMMSGPGKIADDAERAQARKAASSLARAVASATATASWCTRSSAASASPVREAKTVSRS